MTLKNMICNYFSVISDWWLKSYTEEYSINGLKVISSTKKLSGVSMILIGRAHV